MNEAIVHNWINSNMCDNCQCEESFLSSPTFENQNHICEVRCKMNNGLDYPFFHLQNEEEIEVENGEEDNWDEVSFTNH